MVCARPGSPSRFGLRKKFSLTGAFEWFPDKVRLTSAVLLLLLLLSKTISSGFNVKPQACPDRDNITYLSNDTYFKVFKLFIIQFIC